MDTSFSFLSKVPDQRGFIVISDNAVIKSEGDFANRESSVKHIQALVALQSALPEGKTYNVSIYYEDYMLSIARQGKYILVVKRRLPSE